MNRTRPRYIRPRLYRRNVGVIDGLGIPLALDLAVRARRGVKPKTQERHAVDELDRPIRVDAHVTLLDSILAGSNKGVLALVFGDSFEVVEGVLKHPSRHAVICHAGGNHKFAASGNLGGKGRPGLRVRKSRLAELFERFSALCACLGNLLDGAL